MSRRARPDRQSAAERRLERTLDALSGQLRLREMPDWLLTHLAMALTRESVRRKDIDHAQEELRLRLGKMLGLATDGVSE